MLDRNEVSILFRSLMDADVDELTLRTLSENFESTKSLRRHLMLDPKFRMNNPEHSYRGSILREPKLLVETEADNKSLLSIFGRIQDEWEKLGNSDPYWSVLSSEDMRASKIDKEAINNFYESGKGVVKSITSTLDRGSLRKNFNVINEYGCGLGRISKWLSSIGDKVYGYDVSQPHLMLAEEMLELYNIKNVHLRPIKKIEDVEKIEYADLFYCDIVLQHNPPPVIVHILKQLLRHLNQGGVGIFQVPTYWSNYSFNVNSYLESIKPQSGIEMHILPQSKVFQVVRDEKCIVHEVFEDQKAGSPDIISNTFVVEKL